MTTKAPSKLKSKSTPQKAKTKTARRTRSSRSLEEVVGPEVYGAWVSMLRVLVPGGRTHRLAPLLAAMLQYACSVTEDKRDDDADEKSLSQSLMDSTESSDPSEVNDLLHDAGAQLF